jgi:hypothetical protein
MTKFPFLPGPLRLLFGPWLVWVVWTDAGLGQDGDEVELVALGALAGSAKDLSMLEGNLEDGTPHDQLGGFSAWDYTGEGNEYWVLPDRGPADGAVSYACRVHRMELVLDDRQRQLTARLLATHLLKLEDGNLCKGSLRDLPLSVDQRGVALDPEGLRLMPGKALAISDEYGPAVDRFTVDGRRQGSWSLPDWMRLTREPKLSKAALGVMPNRGLEGLAISPDGRRLTAAMQGPLIQDSVPQGSKRYGNYTRLIQLAVDQNAEPLHQWLYPLADRSTGISEILAIDDHRYLVIERDGELRPGAKFKRIYVSDTRRASDVADMTSVPDNKLPAEIVPAQNRLLIDLLDPRWSIPAEHRLEKPEGLAWGPPLADGRRLLLLCFDNDFQSNVPTLLLAFAVRIAD